jgi:heme exporter protein D
MIDPDVPFVFDRLVVFATVVPLIALLWEVFDLVKVKKRLVEEDLIKRKRENRDNQ